MGMHVPISVFAVVAFIMIFTYTAVAIIYPEDEPWTEQHGYGYTRSQDISFNEWLDYQFACAWNILVRDDNNCESQPMWSVVMFNYVKEDYQNSVIGWGYTGEGIFDEFQIVERGGRGCGLSWFNSDFPNGQGLLEWLFGTTPAERIREDYDDWMGIEDDEAGFWDAVMQFFGALGGGFIQLIRLLTFSTIPHIPTYMYVILNIFFIPMWIILMMGIAPVVAKFIEAIGNVIPFT